MEKLADFIMSEIDREPSRSEGAVDCAIRIIKDKNKEDKNMSDSPESINIESERTFRNELESLINRKCKENGSNTPDFILAEYLNSCLSAFDVATQKREKWYGRELKFTHARYGVPLTSPTDSTPKE